MWSRLLADRSGPSNAFPFKPDDRHNAKPSEVGRYLSAGLLAQARASDAIWERRFAERLDLPWRDRTRDLGQPVDFQVSCWQSDRGVMADTTITFAHGTLSLRIGFVPSGQVSGLSLLERASGTPLSAVCAGQCTRPATE